jgi:K+ transporter
MSLVYFFLNGYCVSCETGTEAMFADLGHFNVRAIQVIKQIIRILWFFMYFYFE